MTAYEHAQQLYTQFPGRNFDADLALYARCHYVYADPKAIILAKVLDGNTWFIYLAAGPGSLSKFFELAPLQLTYVCFERPAKGSKSRRYDFKRMQKLCKQLTNKFLNGMCADLADRKHLPSPSLLLPTRQQQM